jgi:glycosyltransferase involved in cell wall biosynthesis
MFIAKDEEEQLPEALASVSFADEILVIDGGSSDRTREVARQFGARVVSNVPWPGFAAQRNVGFDAARHDLVLFLDADERVSPALRVEIEALRASDQPLKAGYRIPRVAHYMGRWIRGTDWYPDWQLRLFDRRLGRCQPALVHESVKVRGEVSRLRGEIIHFPYLNISDHVCTIDEYTSLWARQAFESGLNTSFGEMLGTTAFALLRNYVLRGGFRYGRAGLVISVLNSYYTFLKFAKLMERHAATPAR